MYHLSPQSVFSLRKLILVFIPGCQQACWTVHDMITSKAYKNYFTTTFLSKNALHLLGVITAPKSGDHASFITYYSSKEFNREVQSIFSITTLHPIAPDFWNYQCSFYVDFWTEGLVFHKFKESITTFWYYKVDPPEQQCD